MIRIAVCEDEKKDAQLTGRLIRRYLDERQFDGAVDFFDSGEKLLSGYKPGGYSIVFLDVYMKGVTGVEAARRIRALDRDCAVIFTTVSESHAVEGFEVGAAHYLTKPLTFEKIAAGLDRCQGQLQHNARFVEVLSSRNPTKILLRDILYAEVYQKSVAIHTAAGKINASMSLDALEELLGGPPFARCHRSFLLNMNHIGRLADKNVVLRSGAEIPVGRSLAERFKRIYSEFVVALARNSGVS